MNDISLMTIDPNLAFCWQLDIGQLVYMIQRILFYCHYGISNYELVNSQREHICCQNSIPFQSLYDSVWETDT